MFDALVLLHITVKKKKIRLVPSKKHGLGASRESLAASDLDLPEREKFSSVSLYNKASLLEVQAMLLRVSKTINYP